MLAFAVDKASGRLTLLNEIASCGAFPNYIAIDRTGRYLFITNYGSEDETISSARQADGSYQLEHHYDEGSTILVSIGEDGSLEGIKELQLHGERPSRNYARLQSSQHPHSVNISPDNRLVLVADRGCDALLAYGFDAHAGKMSLCSSVKTKAGLGPRNTVFDPKSPYVYLVYELYPYLEAFRYDGEGRLESLGLWPTVPAESVPGNLEEFRKCPHPSDVRVHPSGRYLYASNRGHGSIVSYRIEETGRLTYLEHVPVGGKLPRSFAIDDIGDFLAAADQETGNLNIYAVEPDGRLRLKAWQTCAKQPVCVRFAEL